jgi:hypothetical protein
MRIADCAGNRTRASAEQKVDNEQTESNEPAEPGDAPIIEEVRPPGAVAEEVDEKRPGSDREVYLYVGEMRVELKQVKQEVEKLKNILADFELATADALAADAAQDEKQSEVIDEIAAKVLPDDSEAAIAHNPEHELPPCSWWESMVGGCPKR